MIPVRQDLHDIMAYYRKGENQTLLVVAAFGNENKVLALPVKPKKILLSTLAGGKEPEFVETKDGWEAVLDGYLAFVAEL